MEEKKIVTLETLKPVVDKIKADYPTNADVDEKISSAALGGGVAYATEAEVLALFEGKTPLVVELKVEKNNAAALTDAAMALLKDWNGVYCVESFHPGVLLRLKKKYPDVAKECAKDTPKAGYVKITLKDGGGKDA